MKNEKLPRGLRIDRGSYVAFLTQPDGPPKRRVVGRVGVITAKWAAQQHMIWLRQIAQGTYERKQPKPMIKETTCADLWDAYKKDCETRDVKRIDRLVFAWKHLKPVFACRPASAVRPREVADYVAARRAAGAAPATCNREVAILKAAFRHGARLEMLPAVPLFPKKLKEANVRKGFVSEEQYKQLAAGARDLWLRTFLALGFAFGFRKSEMLSLRVRNIDLLDGSLTLETSKNGESRFIKLTAETKMLLAECIRGKRADDFALTHPDGSRVSQPRKTWYALCVSCGLGKLDEDGHYEGLQMHDLRRSAVRRLVRRGVPEKTCMTITGHKTRSIFDRYNIVNERDLEEAARLLEDQPSRRSETDTKTDTSVFAHS